MDEDEIKQAEIQEVDEPLEGIYTQLPTFSDLRRSASIAKLTGAMAEAAQEFGEVLKESENPFFKSSYADLATMIKATRAQMGKHGCFLFQFPRGITVNGVMVTTLLSHISGEWIEFDLSLPAAKQDIQGVGSATTYNRRYAYGPLLNLAGEEDDDGNRAMGSRKEHLTKLDDQMKGQERITLAQAKAFDDAAGKTKSKEQIEKYLEQLNGYRASTEIQKRQFNDAIKWAVTRTGQPSVPEEGELTHVLDQSLDFTKLNKELRAAATRHNISNSDIHQFIREQYHEASLKDLSEEQLKQVIRWVDEQ